MRLLLASGNPHKRRELSAILAPIGVQVVAPADVGGIPEVEEDADTFAGNAAKKAVSAATAKAMWALADDSGLEVQALGGAPGVRSARYAGASSDAQRNNEKLLSELEGVPPERRAARFVCALALARPDGSPCLEIEGRAEGRILTGPRGAAGFGYDPLFLFTEEDREVGNGRTFAEMTLEEKSLVSHRGRALRRLAAELPDLMRRQDA